MAVKGALRMDIGYIITFVICFIIIAYGINFSKNRKTNANMLVAKGVWYFFLAAAVFINVCSKGNAERFVTGLTLGIAIIEGSTALKDGIEKLKQYFEDQKK